MMAFEAGPDAVRCSICTASGPKLSADGRRPGHLSETSPYLKKRLEDRFSGMDIGLTETADKLPEVPLFGVANEFFDALAIRQAVKTWAGWTWRAVGFNGTSFVLTDGPALTKDEQVAHQLDNNRAPGRSPNSALIQNRSPPSWPAMWPGSGAAC